MKKRLISAILILLLLLPTLAASVAFFAMPESPFDLFDSARKQAISASLSTKSQQKGSALEPISAKNRHIVRFKDSATLAEIEAALEGLEYRPLAETEQRLFSVSEAEGFLGIPSHIIDYSEPDLQRSTLNSTNDPVPNPALDQISLPAVWEKVQAKENIIVAVLDTGVNRSHEDLAEANILAGYDAVAKTAGVFEDTVGHGTGVIGIIAATPNNNLGIAGAASGVTVLPIRVSASEEVIYSSDLISGIRFAADAGAKIINMSVGGYSSSYAEQDAVNYALSKGCILIAAAGNGGDRVFGDQKSYPASYEGVISVASCNSEGDRSSFSQYNNAVDVAAPGENIHMPFTDEEGRSVYRTDSGTSYSCAYVSAIAALAASHITEGVRFGGEEFLALIAEAGTLTKTDELGYGVINALDIIEITNTPIVTGVVHGGRYSESVSIGFNRGTATLDGEPFFDGDSVFANGAHLLRVTEGDTEKRIYFRLNYDPLTVEFKEFAAFSYFEFSRGHALLNGFPYTSGMRITASGRQHFVLTDGDERIEREVYLGYSLPTVYGITDGGVYSRPMPVKVIGNGSATLDGTPVSDEFSVFESGIHTLTVVSANGAVTRDYTFEIDFPQGRLFQSDYSGAKAAIDEEQGYICIYGESLTGFRIYSAEAPQAYLEFVHVGEIYSHRFQGDYLILLGENGVTFVNRALVSQGAECVEKTVGDEKLHLYAFAENEIYGFGGEAIYRFDPENGQAEPIADLGFVCRQAIFAQGRFLLASESGRLAFFDCDSAIVSNFSSPVPFEHEVLYFNGELLAVGGTVINPESGKILLETAFDSVIKIENNCIVTENFIIDLESGAELAVLPFELCSIAETEESVWLFGWNCEIAVASKNAPGLYRYCAAEKILKAVSESEAVNYYRTNAFIGNRTAISASASENSVYFILNGENALFSVNTLTLAESTAVPLRYTPSYVSASEGYITVTFANLPFIYLAPEASPASGSYIAAPALCSSAFVSGNAIIAACGGRIAYSSLNTPSFSYTAISATHAFPLEKGFGVANENRISVYDQSFRLQEHLQADSAVLAFRNGIGITAGGVYDFSADAQLGMLAVKKATAAAINPSNSLFAFGEGIITLCSFGNGAPVNAPAQIVGIEQGGVYTESVEISFENGLGYIDNEPLFSGEAVDAPGNRRFTVALPCGRSETVDFSLEAKLGGIEFLGGNRTMSVGEKITLRIKYLPEGASSLPVTFICESDGITLSESGEITANAVGEYTIGARVETEGGTLTAQCVITVRNDLLAFIPESGITVDRDNSLALGIPAGTEPSALQSMIITENRVAFSKLTGKYIATGTKIMLYDSEGNVTDTLTACVLGDTDGDGYISAYDIYRLEQILGNRQFGIHFEAAADINRNGVLADNDLRILKSIVLGREQAQLGDPSANIFGRGSVQTLSVIESGEIIDIALCLSGSKYAKAISGVIEFSGLEFMGAESTGWKIGASASEGAVAFYAFGKNGEECGKAFKVVLNLRFRVTARVGEEITLSADWLKASFGDDCRLIHFEPQSFSVVEPKRGEFSFDFLNAESFEFNLEKTDYKITIPYNSALADIAFTRTENQTVSVSGLVIPDSGEGIFNISLSDKNGSSRYYTVTVQRESEPRFDTNCRLQRLELEGFRLTPTFDPNVLEYRIDVPFGTQKIAVHAKAQSDTAQISVSGNEINGKNGIITVTVASPDGESLTYTIEVTVLPEQAESSEETSDPEPQPQPKDEWLKTMLIIPAGMLTAAAAAFFYLRIAKKDEIRKTDETEKTKEES